MASIPSPRLASDSWGGLLASQPRAVKALNAALVRYFDSVVAALTDRGVVVLGVETTREDGVFHGVVHLAEQRRHPASPRGAIQLAWGETTGWQASGCEHLAGGVRYLQTGGTPEPELVASFADGLLCGQDNGRACPEHTSFGQRDPVELCSALDAIASARSRV